MQKKYPLSVCPEKGVHIKIDGRYTTNPVIPFLIQQRKRDVAIIFNPSYSPNYLLVNLASSSGNEGASAYMIL